MAERTDAARPSRWLIALAAAAALVSPTAAAETQPGPLAPFDALVGRWSCAGHFVSNGQSLAARITMQKDENSAALIVRHDDAPPGAYHALEVWTPGKDGKAFRAAITDPYSGMRWFASAGWESRVLTWVGPAEGKAHEQFAYTLEESGALKVDWSVAKPDGSMRLGDTLECHKSADG